MAEQTNQDSTKSLMEEIGITDREIANRCAFLELGEKDIKELLGIDPVAEAYADPVIEDFYKHLLNFEETRVFFQDRQVLERVKRAQKQYFARLTRGNYDKDYIEDRLKIGAVHERIGLPVKAYLGMYNFYLRNVAARLFDEYKNDREKALRAFLSLLKVVFLDMGLAIDTYINRREQLIGKQQEAMRELPTPVLRVRERLLILPVVGVLESYRAHQLTEQLLESIGTTRAKAAIVDITGVPVVDSRVANHLLQTVSAARLMGATVILTGLSSQIAQALVAIGVDLSQVKTTVDLQSGLEEAERLLGYRLVPAGDKARSDQLHP
ncbi:protoglobin domain-containing protein [Methylomicrobium sp. RS1]|jgi:rsbT co-antagonist protein RsbR|uniref:protoglobin domain-containing protein n=1 Tax=Candidatus Methylomicrobium oryzae TaxID=2802053 RepID=UPI001924F80A|nr:protoglobin domain-containing protein [Methylomicrobium sp. RS1]MBL1263979.1 STAS domain-containing protein [Methylomicrobium sp. RS1]